MAGTAARNLTGLTGGTDGRVITLINVGTFPITLKDSVTSTAANQFALTADIPVATDETVTLIYDSTAARWKQVAKGSATGAGDNLGNHTATANIQLGANWLSGDGGNEGIKVDASGNVGIGISAPDTMLEVGGTAGSWNSATMKANMIIGDNATYPLPVVGFIDTGADTSMVGIDNGDYFAIATESSQAGIRFKVNGSSGANYIDTGSVAMTISTAGNVNIAQSASYSGDITPTALAANTNDWAPANLATASVIRMSASAAYNLTGLTGGADGRVLTIMNVGTFAITLKNQNASSTAANRFAINADIVLKADQSVSLIYDATSQRWRSASIPFSGARCPLQEYIDDIFSGNCCEGVGGISGNGTYIYAARYTTGLEAYSFNGTAFTYLAVRAAQAGIGFLDVFVSGSYIYTAEDTAGIRAFTFNGTTFTQAGTISTGSNARQIWSDGTTIFVANTANVRAYTFNGTTFTLRGTYTPPSSPNVGEVWGDGTYIYISDETNGKVYALTFAGTTWTLKGSVTLPDIPQAIKGDGTYIYMTANYAFGNHVSLFAYTFNGTTFTLAGQYNTTHRLAGTDSISVNNGIIYIGGESVTRAFTFNGTSFTPIGNYVHIGQPIYTDGSYLYTGGDQAMFAYPLCQ